MGIECKTTLMPNVKVASSIFSQLKMIKLAYLVWKQFSFVMTSKGCFNVFVCSHGSDKLNMAYSVLKLTATITN